MRSTLYPTLLNLAGASAARGEAARRPRGLGDDQRGKALARRGDRLRHPALPRRDPAGRLETHLADSAAQAVELYNIAMDPAENDNVAAAHPDEVALLQRRANELAASVVEPLIQQTEFIKAMKQRLSLRLARRRRDRRERRQIRGGGLRVNDAALSDEKALITRKSLQAGGVVKLRGQAVARPQEARAFARGVGTSYRLERHAGRAHACCRARRRRPRRAGTGGD